MEKQAAGLILHYRYHPAWVTLPVWLQPFPSRAPCPVLQEAKGRSSSTGFPTSLRPPFKCRVPLPIKNLPFFGLSSSISSSCPASPSASLGQGKGLSSMASPPCLGTTGTSRIGPRRLLPGAASLSLRSQLRAGVPGAEAADLQPSSSGTEHHSFCQTQGSVPSALTLCAGTSAYKFLAGTEGALLILSASSAFDNISA